MSGNYFHQTVLQNEAVDNLVTNPAGIYVDCTLGGGGHSGKILERLNPEAFLVCLDADPDAIENAKNRFSGFKNVRFHQVFFNQLDIVLVQENLLPASGVLFDLGLSSYQIDTGSRGFSIKEDGPLDMRFNPTQSLTAAEVVNEYGVDRLGQIFREYGEERAWKKIAKKIDAARKVQRIESTRKFADLISSCVPQNFQHKTLARIFQAVRIEVNGELTRLKEALTRAFDVMDRNGRIVVLSYHSLEDKLVKNFFRFKESSCICPQDFPKCMCDKVSELKVITRKPVLPGVQEVEVNPRARSAKMRVAEKIVEYRGTF